AWTLPIAFIVMGGAYIAFRRSIRGMVTKAFGAVDDPVFGAVFRRSRNEWIGEPAFAPLGEPIAVSVAAPINGPRTRQHGSYREIEATYSHLLPEIERRVRAKASELIVTEAEPSGVREADYDFDLSKIEIQADGRRWCAKFDARLRDDPTGDDRPTNAVT